MHTNSLRLFQRYAAQFFKPGVKVLEIGPDTIPSTYQREGLPEGRDLTWHTLELHGLGNAKKTTYVSRDEYTFPVQSNSYDVVLSGQVIEHVPKVWIWIKELSRVCKPGGYVITIAPVSWPYHEAPIDCWRIYPDGMKALYEEVQLKTLVNRFETLEVPTNWVARPGMSAPPRNPNTIIRRLLRLPIACAFDTITIGKKVR